jgi:hypothetical protein
MSEPVNYTSSKFPCKTPMKRENKSCTVPETTDTWLDKKVLGLDVWLETWSTLEHLPSKLEDLSQILAPPPKKKKKAFKTYRIEPATGKQILNSTVENSYDTIIFQHC